MDPNANLQEQKEIATRLQDMEDPQSPEAGELAMRLGELVLALDEWISSGGFLPKAWRGGGKGS